MNKKVGNLSDLFYRYSIMIMLAAFSVLMSWMLIWPEEWERSSFKEYQVEASEYDRIERLYSDGIAELMRRHPYFYERSLSLLQQYKVNCFMAEYAQAREREELNLALKVRRENLCDVFADAAAMVDTYPDRLGALEGGRPALLHFTFLEGEEEKAIGPFLSLEECSMIAARLAQLGERVTSCQPYEEWHYSLFFASSE
ncbi:hypothetical protein [Billgrantia saliphila]|uniref:hypothetical protein n=1 Tax=Billgrantia saliphila TaxID=1848458 RepID=UPI000CE437EF|nr:hypothetical protein [Halomonas saliphila]